MKKLLFALAGIGLMMGSCSEGGHEGHDHSDHGNETPESTFNTYGEAFDPTDAVELKDVVASMSTQDTGEFVFKGKINQTCAKAGCWMSVDMPDETEMMVYMGDHDFFVPKSEAAGLDCYVKGMAYHDTVSVEFQKHLLEDANASQEEIDAVTDIKLELAFKATGVIIDGYEGEEKGLEHDDHKDCDHDHDHDDHDHDDHDHGDAEETEA